MNTNVIWLLLLLLSAQPADALAASGQIDPTKPGGPARDNTLGAPPPASSSKTPSGERKKSDRAERMQRISGVITTVTSLDLVVTQSVRKEKKTVRFVLRPDTVKEGELRPGAQVTVEYQAEGDKNVANESECNPKGLHVRDKRSRKIYSIAAGGVPSLRLLVANSRSVLNLHHGSGTLLCP